MDANSSYVGQSQRRYGTPWEDSSAALAHWMKLEGSLRAGASLDDLTVPFDDPMLMEYLRAIDVFWAFKRGATGADLEGRLDVLGDSDVGAVAREFVNRPNAHEH